MFVGMCNVHVHIDATMYIYSNEIYAVVCQFLYRIHNLHMRDLKHGYHIHQWLTSNQFQCKVINMH